MRRMRILYGERRTILVESIDREFGSMVEVLGSDAGMHLTMKLPNEVSDIQIAERLPAETFGFGRSQPLFLAERHSLASF